jgi:hypothetical protein
VSVIFTLFTGQGTEEDMEGKEIGKEHIKEKEEE